MLQEHGHIMYQYQMAQQSITVHTSAGTDACSLAVHKNHRTLQLTCILCLSCTYSAGRHWSHVADNTTGAVALAAQHHQQHHSGAARAGQRAQMGSHSNGSAAVLGYPMEAQGGGAGGKSAARGSTAHDPQATMFNILQNSTQNMGPQQISAMQQILAQAMHNDNGRAGYAADTSRHVSEERPYSGSHGMSAAYQHRAGAHPSHSQHRRQMAPERQQGGGQLSAMQQRAVQQQLQQWQSHQMQHHLQEQQRQVQQRRAAPPARSSTVRPLLLIGSAFHGLLTPIDSTHAVQARPHCSLHSTLVPL